MEIPALFLKVSEPSTCLCSTQTQIRNPRLIYIVSQLKAASPQFQGCGTNLSVSAVEMSNLDILFNEEEL